MIVGKTRCLPVSSRAQGGRDRAPCRREHGAGDEDERVSCGWGREPRQQRPHPGEQKGRRFRRTQHDSSPRPDYLWEQLASSLRRRGAAMTRDQILERYRHLREISTGHHSGALKFVPRQALLEHAKRLGLATGQTLVAESEAGRWRWSSTWPSTPPRSAARGRWTATPEPHRCRPALTQPACW